MSLRGDNTKAMPSVHNQIFAQISSETSDQFEAHEIQMSERYPKEFTAGKCVVGVVLGRLSMIDHLYGYVIRRECEMSEILDEDRIAAYDYGKLSAKRDLPERAWVEKIVEQNESLIIESKGAINEPVA